MIQIGGVYTHFCQKEGILLQKYRNRNGRCIAILFKRIGVRGRFDRADFKGAEKKTDSPKHPFARPFPRTTPSLLLWRARANLLGKAL